MKTKKVASKKPKSFKWVVEFSVNETWVADGFDPDDDVFRDMIANCLSYAYPEETDAKILKRPSKARIEKAQGHQK